MPVAPEMQAYLGRLEATGARAYGTLPVEEHRRLFEEAAPPTFGEVPPVPFAERTIPGPSAPIPVRVYTPASDEAPPALVYFHGGGWVVGSPRTHHAATATLAQETPCVVVSVDYRRAPEHPFPAANEDAWAALEWAAQHAEA
jgi:acetyl esterase